MDAQDFLTIDEAAKLLQMHPVTVRRHLRNATIPGRKIGGEWRISRRALEDFLKGGQPSPDKATDSPTV